MAALPVLVSAVVEASQTLVAGITIQPTGACATRKMPGLPRSRPCRHAQGSAGCGGGATGCAGQPCCIVQRAVLVHAAACVRRTRPAAGEKEGLSGRWQCHAAADAWSQILDEGTPLGMLKIEPASRLVWCGDVKLKSDVSWRLQALRVVG